MPPAARPAPSAAIRAAVATAGPLARAADPPFAPDLYGRIAAGVAACTGLALLALLTRLPTTTLMLAGLVPAAAVSAAAGLLWPATLGAACWAALLAVPAWLLLGL